MAKYHHLPSFKKGFALIKSQYDAIKKRHPKLGKIVKEVLPTSIFAVIKTWQQFSKLLEGNLIC